MGTIRWGIIGCGDVTEVKSGPALQKAEGSALTAVMRRSGELAKDYASRHGVPKWYDDAERLIADPEVDAVYVATPPSSHLQYALLAARAGKPVYVEKPMARNTAECEAMIAACATAGVPLYVAYYRRAHERFARIRELLAQGAIGQVRFVRTLQTGRVLAPEQASSGQLWRIDPKIAGGGLFVDLASHTLDVLDHLLGPISDCTGIAANQAGRYEAEDIVSGTYRFASGAIGTGTWCFSAYEGLDRNELIGSDGALVFPTFGDWYELHRAGGAPERFTVPNPQHVQQPLIQQIVDELRGRGRSSSTGQSALRTNRVMDALLQPYYGYPC
ncbi:Gfo/Idh/MocA family oxidoreductase [Paenibacillus sp. IB182496]|uniref:Gfo/Idh/MocA family oxidoreductase n=1 Tax=Paenibacillus sabuli TaxID=2772509 RepID=A0A927GTZ2_9BACL|nr:Gfo/Idh/MocA family oxidoreductase [Paenibacillus sabuli]MBD2848133.1 Gfo/Idh/MocA family oxidoreductase [Paenibacillus sabuli]